jgi:hypothetical protein
MTTKLTAKLAEQLDRADASDLLEIILELRRPQAESATTQETRSRSEKIAALKESFSREVTPVEEAVRKLGGEVTGRAWINQTVRARMPAQGVRELSEHEKISVLDIPHSIKSDFG